MTQTPQPPKAAAGTAAKPQRRFLRLGQGQRVHAPVSLRLLRALLTALDAGQGPLCMQQMVTAVYGGRAHPNARHSIDTLLRRIASDGVQIARPDRGLYALAEVSRETVVSILERQGAVLALAGAVADPVRVDSLRSIIDMGLAFACRADEAAA